MGFSRNQSKREKLTIASEVERTINQYLVDDHSKVEPTNIARKLRSSTMQSKPWLITYKTGVADKKLYGVSDGWDIYWREMFNEEPPILA